MADPPAVPDPPSPLDALRARTPARLFVGRAGAGYRTATALGLARTTPPPSTPSGSRWTWCGTSVPSSSTAGACSRSRGAARSKAEYLARPDLGRCLSDAAREAIAGRCPRGADLQIAIGDGLSATAVMRQVPALLPGLAEEGRRRGWSFGQPFAVRYCRVAVLNDMGECLDPAVAILLIGERPGWPRPRASRPTSPTARSPVGPMPIGA